MQIIKSLLKFYWLAMHPVQTAVPPKSNQIAIPEWSMAILDQRTAFALPHVKLFRVPWCTDEERMRSQVQKHYCISWQSFPSTDLQQAALTTTPNKSHFSFPVLTTSTNSAWLTKSLCLSENYNQWNKRGWFEKWWLIIMFQKSQIFA